MAALRRDQSGPTARGALALVELAADAVGPARLVGPDGQAEQFDNGARVPLRERPIASRQLLFPIVLGPGETRTAYLRLSGSGSLVADLVLWHPAANADARELRWALRYLAIGTTAVVVVYSVLAWRARRRLGLLGRRRADLLVLLQVLPMEFRAACWPAGTASPARS